jgi:DinB superfamily
MPTRRPESQEHSPHHHHYIELVPEGPVLETLRRQRDDVERILLAIDEERLGYRYAPGKWTVREVVGHMADAERIYDYRALAFARGDAGAMPKYDPDGYVAAAGFDNRTMTSLVRELVATRDATLQLFENLPHEAWERGGTLGGNFLSVRALAFIAAGHWQRHLNVLHDRYGLLSAVHRQ